MAIQLLLVEQHSVSVCYTPSGAHDTSLSTTCVALSAVSRDVFLNSYTFRPLRVYLPPAHAYRPAL